MTSSSINDSLKPIRSTCQWHTFISLQLKEFLMGCFCSQMQQINPNDSPSCHQSYWTKVECESLVCPLPGKTISLKGKAVFIRCLTPASKQESCGETLSWWFGWIYSPRYYTDRWTFILNKPKPQRIITLPKTWIAEFNSQATLNQTLIQSQNRCPLKHSICTPVSI